ncbi:hypothetical protein [Nocardia sp. NPDC052566]|uniref:hypothetical protein n=1 Tax=Nocardia sp. NPDC052566 TaxID=3364330 RepID=UPI0037C7BEFE
MAHGTGRSGARLPENDHEIRANPDDPEALDTSAGSSTETPLPGQVETSPSGQQDKQSLRGTLTAEGSQSADSVPSTTAAKAKKPATKPKVTIADANSFADFLRCVLDAEGKLTAVELREGSVARAALAATTDLERFDDAIREIAARDTRLSTALALMKTADRSNLRGAARRNLTALAARLLGLQPAFVGDQETADRLSALLTGTHDANTLQLLVIRLRDRVVGTFDGKD